MTDEEVEQKADVLCLVFDPADNASYGFAEELDKKLPASVPRVVLSISAENEEPPIGDLATENRLKQYQATSMCVDDKSIHDAMALVVGTALRPYVTSCVMMFAVGLSD